MGNIFSFIYRPFGWFLGLLYAPLHSFPAAVFVFTLIINLLLIPLSIKQQKTMVNQTRMKPKLDAIKEKYPDDRQRQAQEQQKLMSQSGSNPLSGCLPMLIRLPFLWAVYNAVSNPLSYIAGLSQDKIDAAKAVLGKLNLPGVGKTPTELNVVSHLQTVIAHGGTTGWSETATAALHHFTFLGIDLTQQPVFTLDFSTVGPIWFIPLMSFGAAMLTSLLSMFINKKMNPDMPNSMAGMMLMMPVISLVFGFMFPGVVGFYWACSSLVMGLIQAAMQYFYHANVIIAKEEADAGVKRREHERKKIHKIEHRLAENN